MPTRKYRWLPNLGKLGFLIAVLSWFGVSPAQLGMGFMALSVFLYGVLTVIAAVVGSVLDETASAMFGLAIALPASAVLMFEIREISNKRFNFREFGIAGISLSGILIGATFLAAWMGFEVLLVIVFAAALLATNITLSIFVHLFRYRRTLHSLE